MSAASACTAENDPAWRDAVEDVLARTGSSPHGSPSGRSRIWSPTPQGDRPAFAVACRKKARGKPRSMENRLYYRVVSPTRMPGEHAIGRLE